MSVEVLPGCEPFSHAGAPAGVLVLHGFTGNPTSMRPLAEAAAAAGYSVELPRLPGHGTSVEDMVTTRFEDWLGEAEAAYDRLVSRGGRVAVVGLSMGGTLAVRLAETREVAGAALINPLVKAQPETLEGIGQLLEAGLTTVEAIGSDIKREGTRELSYDATPLAGAQSLFRALGEVEADLVRVTCPVLLVSSREDHVVPPENGDLVAARVSGPLERVWLEDSYHVATLDNDRDLVEASVTAFLARVLA
ncbi:MAG TPA: alpha/beta fold hydrolase [Acidimicrobiales bacterium]|nr:alpha/beta fold hydrolase [Acidimicrobiales bacterium]